MILKIWPDGSVVAENKDYMYENNYGRSDDYFVVDPEKLSQGKTVDLISKYFNDPGQYSQVWAEVEEYCWEYWV